MMRLFGAALHESTAATLVKITAIFWVYLLNVFLQPLQFGMRTLILEQSATALQPAVNAWASRFSTLGNVFMCAVGFLDVSKWLPDGVDRFHSLVLVAVVVLTLTVGITCLSVHEYPTWLQASVEDRDKGSVFANLLEAWVMMPELSYKVCRVQFVSWLGWFPILFYSSR
jgi:solute carrier family 45 protein 1/2/4